MLMNPTILTPGAQENEQVFRGLPIGTAKVILADPPWKFRTYNAKGRRRCPDWKPFKGSPAKHYDTMEFAQIASLPVKSLASDDCCLFLWATWPLLLDALLLIDIWGFTYKTCGFDWMKINLGDRQPSIGCGYWTRANTEPCLLATRGKPRRVDAGVRMAVLERRRESGRKPDCVRERIEQLLPGPYVELFARSSRQGWLTWGDETSKFDR